MSDNMIMTFGLAEGKIAPLDTFKVNFIPHHGCWCVGCKSCRPGPIRNGKMEKDVHKALIDCKGGSKVFKALLTNSPVTRDQRGEFSAMKGKMMEEHRALIDCKRGSKDKRGQCRRGSCQSCEMKGKKEHGRPITTSLEHGRPLAKSDIESDECRHGSRSKRKSDRTIAADIEGAECMSKGKKMKEHGRPITTSLEHGRPLAKSDRKHRRC